MRRKKPNPPAGTPIIIIDSIPGTNFDAVGMTGTLGYEDGGTTHYITLDDTPRNRRGLDPSFYLSCKWYISPRNFREDIFLSACRKALDNPISGGVE